MRKETKNTLRILAFYAIFFIAGTLLFIGLFHTQLFKSVDILFYRGILLLATTCISITAIQTLLKRHVYFSFITCRDVLLCLTLVFCLNLVFFTHVPVTADRSISIFILGYMNNNSEKTIPSQDMANIFTSKYLYEYGAMNKRFNEQVVSGNIVQDGSGYKITKQGQRVMKIYTLVAKLFNINNKIISP